METTCAGKEVTEQEREELTLLVAAVWATRRLTEAQGP